MSKSNPEDKKAVQTDKKPTTKAKADAALKKTAPAKAVVKKPSVQRAAKPTPKPAATAKKSAPAKSAVKKTAAKKPAPKIAAQVKAAAKSATRPAKKAVSKKTAAKKTASRKASAKGGARFDNPWNVPDEILNLLLAFEDDGGKIGNKYATAVQNLSDRRVNEIMASLNWDCPSGVKALKYFKDKFQCKDGDLQNLKQGKPISHFRFKDVLLGEVFKKNPLTPEEIRQIVDELMRRLGNCICCCRCWPCGRWPFCRICRRSCLVEVSPIASIPAGYTHVHRLDFPDAVITASGLTATIATGGGAGSHDHDGVYEPVINPKYSAFNKNFGAGAAEVAPGNHAHAGVYEPVINLKNSAFNQNFGAGNTDVARGDHDHESCGSAGNWTPAYARKFFYNQVVNPALSPNGGPAGSNPGEAEILIADTAATRERIQAMQSGGATLQLVVKGFAVEGTSAIQLIITTTSLYHDVPSDNYYLRFKISDGVNNYRPGVAPWDSRQCFITYFIFE